MCAVPCSWGGRCLSLAPCVAVTGSTTGRPLLEGANVAYALADSANFFTLSTVAGRRLPGSDQGDA